jgi:hypothetical protein
VEGADSLCLLSVDQIPGVIRELQAPFQGDSGAVPARSEWPTITAPSSALLV